MITKSQFCHGGSVPDVGDLVEVIFAPVIIYFFDFTVGSHFVALISLISLGGEVRHGSSYPDPV